MICGQGPAPAGATIEHYRDELGLDLVPGTGLLAACIPGTFDTWMLLLRDYGTMRLADVLAPAICYARNGYPLVERISATIDMVKEHVPRPLADLGRGLSCRTARCRRRARSSPTSTLAETYARVLREAESAGGDRVAQIERARKTWSQGFVAEAIDKFCRTQEVMDTSGERHRGVLTGERHGEMAGHRRSADPLRLRPLHA